MQVLNQALKEWYVVVKALEDAKQFVLLRKGGILDQGFDIASTKFLLFPTFEHQHQQYVRDEFKYLFDKVDDKIIISSAANIHKVYETFSKDKLLRLSKYHIYNEDFIDYRLSIYKDKPVKVLLVKTYLLEEPIALENKPEYAGCRSWVNIDLNPKIREEPVISNMRFDDIFSDIEGIMNEV
ncbi:MAG: hypothetical protein KatS3mg003_0965 [Candidatus Nitrosocaldaceae archaeon]|nr:MAG: hypothetical protein KatS3mg003_0965 [Candidatus Nitrosocaldaceae archaeon]